MVIESLLIVLPFMVGLASSPRRAWQAFAVLLGLETLLMVVALTALRQPLVAAAITASLSVGSFIVGRSLGAWKPRAHFAGLAGVALVCGALTTGTLAGELTGRVRKESVWTALWVDGSEDTAWSAIKDLGPLSNQRPLLMRLAMSPLQRCEPEGESHRTCRFEPAFALPRHLFMQLFTLTRASYRLSVNGAQTHVLRSTDFESRLVPAWLWRPLERLTLEEDHRALLSGLQGRFVPAEERGVALRLSVKTNPRTVVFVIPAKTSPRAELELGKTPLEEVGGAYVGDTLLMVNEEQGIRFEELIESGQPGELKVISKVFKERTRDSAEAAEVGQPKPWGPQ